MPRLDDPAAHGARPRTSKPKHDDSRRDGFAHDHGHSHGPGHNHAHGHELHSHPRADHRADEIRALAATFVEGFRSAEDKTSYLRLAGVPDSIPGPDGLARRLVDVTISDGFQVATASPGFGTRDLVYLPFPGGMIAPRTTLTMTYVSLTGRSDIDLVDFLAGRFHAAK
ncbi:MAG: hypothetical protein KIT43_11470 [Bauldia sp.]|nr:hypothetical protein [Bauldia sp.]